MVFDARFILSCLAAVALSASASAQSPACPAQWTQASPTFNPAGRTECVLVDAPLLGNGVGGVLLFGGFVSIPGNPPTTFTINDTQIWTGANWVTYTGPSPTARRGTAVAFDSTRSRVVMYGGNQATGLGFSELWVFNGTWTQIEHPDAALPGPRFRASMVFDPARDRFVMFGGARSTTPGDTKYLDTWELSASSVGLGAPIWTLVEASSATSPANADYFPAVYDSQRGVTLAVTYTGTFSQGAIGAVHEWNGTAWTQRITTLDMPARNGFGLTYDAPRGQTILYGGTDGTSGQRYGDTWEYNGAQWLQTRAALQGPGNANSTFLRQFVAIAYDSRFQTTVHFSGTTAPISSRANDTWLYSSSPAPDLVQPPQSLTVEEHQTASLVASVSAAGGGTGSFQWLRDGVAVTNGPAGASPAGGVVSGASGVLAAGVAGPITLQIASAGLSDAGEYRLRLTSACGHPDGVTSPAAVLTVTPRPQACASIDQAPAGLSAFAGTTVSLTASVAAPPGVTNGVFTWLRNGQPISSGPGGASPGGGVVAGAGGEIPAAPGGTLTLTIQGVQESDTGAYSLRLIADGCAAAESPAASLAVTAQPGCPAFLAGPAATDAVIGQSVSLTARVSIEPGASGTIQWTRNDAPISSGPGGASPGGGVVLNAAGPLPGPGTDVPITLVLVGAQVSDAGAYRLLIASPSCLDPNGASSPPATLSVSEPPPPTPPSDACASAPTLVEGTYSFSTFDATTDGPDEAGACNFFGYTQVGNDVWFHYLPGATGVAVISLCGSSYDTRLAMYEADVCPTQAGGASLCNENGCTGTQQSRIVFGAVAGRRVLFRIGGFGGQQGEGLITIVCGLPASEPTDLCPLAPTYGDGTIVFSIEGALTDGPDEPGVCDFFGYTQVGSDMWLHYAPSCTGTATIDLCASEYDARVAVYAGDACPTAPGDATACNEDGCDMGFGSRLTIPVVGGVPVLIRVGGFEGQQGLARLTISCAPAVVCRADFNHDTFVDPDDLSDYISCFFASPACAEGDFNGDGFTDPDDLSDYISEFFSGAC